jgi:hypothetical protein
MPDKWDQFAEKPTGGGDKWSQYAEPAQSVPEYSAAQPQTLGHGLSEAASGFNPIPGVINMVRHPLDTARGIGAAQEGEVQAAKDAWQRGEPLEAARHTIFGALPVVGPALGSLHNEIYGTDPEYNERGDVAKSGAPPDPIGGIGRTVGSAAGFYALPPLLRKAGEGAEALARVPVKAALGLPGRAEAYGANPAKAVLEETSAVSPTKIATQARSRIGELNTELESRARASQTPVSLKPARDVVAGDISKAAGRNSTAGPRELAPMNSFLNEPQPGFTGATEYQPGASTPISFTQTPLKITGPNGQPILGRPSVVRGLPPSPVVSEEQAPIDALGMRRQLNTDFIRNWNPAASTKGALGTARRAYGAIGSELDKSIPGGSEIDQRISSLIPAAERARATSLNAGLGQRILSRIARPTGGLVPALLGYHGAGIPGAALGLTAAETAAAPVPLMIGGRGIYGLGRGLESPAASTPIRVAPLAKRPQQ